jgi:hypothetical protein
MNTVVRVLVMLALTTGALARQTTSTDTEARPRALVAPLFLRVNWVRPDSQSNTKTRYTPVQENVGDSNVEMKFYGAAARQILTTGVPGSELTPFGIWTGMAEGPIAVTFRLKDNYVDLTGLANLRWFAKTSGFHVVRPVVKLANGNLMVGDFGISSVPKLTLNELALANIRWIKLDPDRVVTVNSGPAAANPNNEIWAPAVDLGKVEEVGFADLMPGSGHGTGGYIQLGAIEVYGKPIPHTSVNISR